MYSSQFLEKNSKKRLGHGIITGWNRIASHPFFSAIDWQSINNKDCQPVYIPLEEQSLFDESFEGNVCTIHEDYNHHDTPFVQNDGVIGWLYNRQKRSSRALQNRESQDMKLLQNNFKSFDYTIFDQYEGFLDVQSMTVGPPPFWVKPAFPDADNGSVLPVRKLYLETTPTVFDIFQSDLHHYQSAATAAY